MPNDRTNARDRRSRPLSFRIAAALIPLLLLGGCFNYDGIQIKSAKVKTVPAWMNLEVVSLVTTKKTMFDHLATWMTGQDCSTPRAEREGTYCVDWPKAPTPPPEVYCYSSLASATCYAKPYVQANDHLIGFVPATLSLR